MIKYLIILFSERLAQKQEPGEKNTFAFSLTADPEQRLLSANEGWEENNYNHPRCGERSLSLAGETDWQIACSIPITTEAEELIANSLRNLPQPSDISRLKQAVIDDDLARFGLQTGKAMYMYNGIFNIRYLTMKEDAAPDELNGSITLEDFRSLLQIVNREDKENS